MRPEGICTITIFYLLTINTTKKNCSTNKEERTTQTQSIQIPINEEERTTQKQKVLQMSVWFRRQNQESSHALLAFTALQHQLQLCHCFRSTLD
jgi:hypothetical protein